MTTELVLRVKKLKLLSEIQHIEVLLAQLKNNIDRDYLSVEASPVSFESQIAIAATRTAERAAIIADLRTAKQAFSVHSPIQKGLDCAISVIEKFDHIEKDTDNDT